MSRPSATAWVDSTCWAMATGCRVWIGSTAVPSSTVVVAWAMSVIAVSASKSDGIWGTQMDENPAASAVAAPSIIRATLSR